MDPVSKKSHWVNYSDQYGDPSEDLVGSREGLLHLRTQIDEALEKGVAAINPNADFPFLRIRVQESRPRENLTTSKMKEMAIKLGFLSVIAVALILMGVGVYHIFQNR